MSNGKNILSNLKETLFHEKLENGLEVYLLPKIGFEKTYGLFSTRFGSIDTTFVPLGQKENDKSRRRNCSFFRT